MGRALAHRSTTRDTDAAPAGDRPYLISGADDKLVKIWDYQTKACVQTLEGHTHNVSAACFHPELPIILSGSEDGTLRIWHANTYRLENILNYSMERLWSLGYVKGSNRCAQNATLLAQAHAFARDTIHGALVAPRPDAWAAQTLQQDVAAGILSEG